MKKNETDWLAQMDAGRACLGEGNYQAAEAIFKKLMVATKDPIARNNYAVSRYAHEDWKRTLEILEPNLQTDVFKPKTPFACIGRRGVLVNGGDGINASS